MWWDSSFPRHAIVWKPELCFSIDRLSGLEETFTTLPVCRQVVKEAEQMKKNQPLISHMRFFLQELVNCLRWELKFNLCNLKWWGFKSWETSGLINSLYKNVRMVHQFSWHLSRVTGNILYTQMFHILVDLYLKVSLSFIFFS